MRQIKQVLTSNNINITSTVVPISIEINVESMESLEVNLGVGSDKD